MVTLRSHQSKAIDQFKISNKGIIIYHSMGSGKTITSIHCVNQYPKIKPIFVTPSSVYEQFSSEVKQHINSNISYNVYTYRKFSDLLETNSIPKNRLIVIDEAHRLRNPNTKSSKLILKYCSKYAFKTLFLTGTLFINFPWDVSPLVNTLKLQDEDKLPVTEERFRKMFYSINRKFPYFIEFINTVDFFEMTDGLISVYDNKSNNPQNFPAKIEQLKPVVMNKTQELLHKKIVSKTIEKQNIKLLGINKNEAKTIKNLNSFLAQTRQLSNVVKGQNTYSPKIISIIDQTINDDSFPAIIYSNFLEAGVIPARQYLNEKYKDISNEVIDGSLHITQKQDIIDDYNNKKIKILFITSSASEGVDLKRTRQIHIMEPHWNLPKLQQVIGRGIRFRSHKNLPEEKRIVTVYKWFSVYSYGRGYTADQFLIDLSKKKEYFCSFFENLLTNRPEYQNIQFISNSPMSISNNNTSRYSTPSKSVNRNAAAMKIQAKVRGTLQRKKFLKKRAVVKSLQKKIRARKVTTRNNKLESLIENLKKKDFGRFSRIVARKMLQSGRPHSNYSKTTGKVKQR